MVKVLFVCTGNICRSPTADGLFRDRAAAAGVAATTDSAGTGDYHIGDPPDPRTIACARARGVDLSMLRARQLVADDFNAFDHILAMDRKHLRRMERFVGTGRAQAALFSDAAGLGVLDVPDPYYGGEEDFDAVFDLIARGVDGLVARFAADRA